MNCRSKLMDKSFLLSVPREPDTNGFSGGPQDKGTQVTKKIAGAKVWRWKSPRPIQPFGKPVNHSQDKGN